MAAPRVVTGARCDDTCVADETQRAYNAVVDLRGLRWRPQTCAVGGRCLDAVEPEAVIGALEHVL